MTKQLTLPRLAAAVAVALTIGCTTAQDSVQAQEGNAMLPKFFEGMTLLEENDCPSFTVKYYATPEVTMAELENPRVEKGWGGVVIPKNDVRLNEVIFRKEGPAVLSQSFFIMYKDLDGKTHDITAQAMDHAAPPESAMIPSPLFQESGVFTFGGDYRTVLGSRTNGKYETGEITIDDRVASIFRGSDGSSCKIQPPKIRFQIK